MIATIIFNIDNNFRPVIHPRLEVMDSLRTKGGRAFFMKLLRSDGVRETQQPEAGRETRTRFVIRYVYEMILDLF